MYLCLPVRDHIIRTTRPIFSKVLHMLIVAVAGSFSGGIIIRYVVSSFMDDVIFAHKPRLLDAAAQLKRSAHAALGLAIYCAQ